MAVEVGAAMTAIQEWRCPTCGALLFRARITLDEGEIVEQFCKRCRVKVVFMAQPGKGQAACTSDSPHRQT